MDPITVGTLLLGAGKAISSYFDKKGKRKIEKKKIKEEKRRTLAQLLNESQNRSHDTSKNVRQSQNELASARARALQEAASHIRQSLGRR